MKVIYDAKKDKYSIVDLTPPEAGAFTGAVEFAIGEKRKQNMYVVTCEKGMLKEVEAIANQLHTINFLNSLTVKN